MNLSLRHQLLFAAVSSLFATSIAQESVKITERAANSQRVEFVETVQDPSGRPVQITNSFIQLETGLNRKDANGEWIPATVEIEAVPGGAVVSKTRHKISFAHNINVKGAVSIRLPELGSILSSSPSGLVYFDSSTGDAAYIGEVQNSEMQIIGQDQIIYPDAFKGVSATIRYTVTKAGVEQDVIIHERLPSPEQFGMNPETTQLEVWSEFFDPPVRKTKSRGKNPHGIEDTDIDFGSMKMMAGKAFPEPGANAQLPVGKEWLTSNGRDFLIEGVKYKEAAHHLKDLPPGKRSASELRKTSRKTLASVVGANRLERDSNTKPRTIAAASRVKSGFVMDWQLLSTSPPANSTFLGTETYSVTGVVVLSDPATTFEGGAVIKFAPGATAKLVVSAGCVWKGSAYRPVVFTARDDNSVGQTVTGSTGIPTGYYADIALSYDGSLAQTALNIAHVRISYAQTGIKLYEWTGHRILHAQFVNCKTAIDASATVYKLMNALVWNEPAWFTGTTVLKGMSATGRAEHLTVDSAASLLSDPDPMTYTLVNSILFGVQASDPFATETSVFRPTANPFKAALAGNHYLPIGNAFQNVGSSSIDATLAEDLKKMTTQGPVVGTSLTSTTLQPNVLRDSDTPDAGYHYYALDYLLSSVLAPTTLVFTNGVAVAFYGNYGLSLQDFGTFTSVGSPGRMNRLCWYPSVQEQSVRPNNISTVNSGMLDFGNAGAPFPGYVRPIVNLRFTDVAMMGKAQVLFTSLWADKINTLNFKDCTFRGVYIAVDSYYSFTSGNPVPTFTFFNNVMERGTFLVSSYYSVTYGYMCPISLYAHNNTFWKATGTFIYNNNPLYTSVFVIRDNLFDVCTVSLSGDYSSSYITRSNNGWVSTTSGNLFGANDVIVNQPAGYTYSTYGERAWYQAGTSMRDHGSRTAALAGLYHYTTQLDQKRDGSSTVDIGFHYPAGLTYQASEDFGTIQGGRRWSYLRTTSSQGLPSPSSPQLNYQATDPGYPTYAPRWEAPSSEDVFCWMGADWMHPGYYFDPVRAFQAPVSGTIIIDSAAYDGDNRGAYDPPRVRILRNSTELITWTTIPEGSTAATAAPLSVTAFTVAAGDYIYFQENKGTIDQYYDKIVWDPRISYLDVSSPSDWDEDGLPDYMEDADGDGIVDGNETNFKQADYNPVTTVALNSSVREDGGPAKVRFVRDRAAPAAMTLSLSHSGSAQFGSTKDYTVSSSSPVIAAGQTSVDISVTPVADYLVEGPELIRIRGYESTRTEDPNRPIATINLEDEDATLQSAPTGLPAVDMGGYTPVLTEDSIGYFRIYRSFPGANLPPLKVYYTLRENSDGQEDTLLAPDGSRLPGYAVIPANATYVEVPIRARNDQAPSLMRAGTIVIKPSNSYFPYIDLYARIRVVDASVSAEYETWAFDDSSTTGGDVAVVQIRRKGNPATGRTYSIPLGGTAQPGEYSLGQVVTIGAVNGPFGTATLNGSTLEVTFPSNVNYVDTMHVQIRATSVPSHRSLIFPDGDTIFLHPSSASPVVNFGGSGTSFNIYLSSGSPATDVSIRFEGAIPDLDYTIGHNIAYKVAPTAQNNYTAVITVPALSSGMLTLTLNPISTGTKSVTIKVLTGLYTIATTDRVLTLFAPAGETINYNKDSDGDGYTDQAEFNGIPYGTFGGVVYGLNPYNRDTDGDGLGDKFEIDHYQYFTALAFDSDMRFRDVADYDGICALDEDLLGLDPYLKDTDGDSVSDYWEAQVNVDSDGDGIDNFNEILRGLNPFAADTDGDGLNDRLDPYPQSVGSPPQTGPRIILTEPIPVPIGF